MKPCPNPSCGGATVHLRGTSYYCDYRIVCNRCHMEGPLHNTADAAITDWNSLPRRSEIAAEIRVRIEDVRKLCVCQSLGSSMRQAGMEDGLEMAAKIVEGK